METLGDLGIVVTASRAAGLLGRIRRIGVNALGRVNHVALLILQFVRRTDTHRALWRVTWGGGADWSDIGQQNRAHQHEKQAGAELWKQAGVWWRFHGVILAQL